ncbi:MAG: hypothetical protein NT015_08515 [Alphaproteobacteria bacterium]|nr:hypothetical protein [Alphaproteobacteria bacterium]
MNERQRDLFLYVWSKRRAADQTAIGLRGLIIGAIGGLVFTFALAGAAGFENFIKILLPAVGAFGGIGFVGANRVYALQENQYQAILATGAQVPAQKPVMQPGDRGPAIAVAIAVAVIAGFIIFVAVTLG